MCSSRMAGDGKGPRRLLRSVAVVLLLFCLTPSLSCFSLSGMSKNVHQEKLVSEAAVSEGRTGHIVFNGKANSPSRSSSAADDRSGLAHVDLPQADGTETLGQAFQLETAQEAAWRRLNPTLSCGANKMKLKAMGPGAAALQLDMGMFNGIEHTLPLVRVPRSCGYSMRQNALGLVLVVPYDGCGVVQENGNYVLPMSWLQNPVKLSCPSQSTYAAPTAEPTTTSTPPLPTTLVPPAMNPAAVNPNTPAYSNYPYFPYMSFYPPFSWPQQWQYAAPPATSAPTTTTAEPVTTTPTTTVATTEGPPAMNPQVNLNYPFSYLSFYPPLGWPQPTVAAATSSDSTTTAPTVNAYPYYEYPYYVWYAGDPASNLPPATTTAATTTMPPTTASPTTAIPTQPSSLPSNYPNYQYYPAGAPSQPGFYYPFIQPQYPQNLNPPTVCANAGASTSCPNKMPSSSSGQSPYYPYSWFPFLEYTWHKNKPFPYSWKYRSPAGYLPGIQMQGQPYPGFPYQQPMPWFSYLGQGIQQGV